MNNNILENSTLWHTKYKNINDFKMVLDKSIDNNLVKTITGNCWLIGIIKDSYSSFFKGHSVAMVRDRIKGRMAKNVTL